MGQWDLVLEILKWSDLAEILTSDVFLGVESKYAIHFSIWIRIKENRAIGIWYWKFQNGRIGLKF